MFGYYVYIYLDPRKKGNYNYGSYKFNYEPFYVGKGKNNRYKDLNKRSKYFKRIINKIKESGLEPIVLKLKENVIEKESFILESELIKLIGRKDTGKGPLINFTNGGEGGGGYICSDKIKEKFKKSFNYIVQEFKKRGYKLLTKKNDYKNAKQKLNYICDKGHKGKMTWDNFRNHKCNLCSRNLISKKQRKNFQDIKKEFEKRNYILLTEYSDYINAHTKLNYICDKKHKYFTTWNNFSKNHKCPFCVGNRIDYGYIKNKFEEKGFILLTKEYKNNNQKLEYTTLNGIKKTITWKSFQKNYKQLKKGVKK